MAAPTNAAFVKKVLANSEPSTHGTFRNSDADERMSAVEGKSGRERARSFEAPGIMFPN